MTIRTILLLCCSIWTFALSGQKDQEIVDTSKTVTVILKGGSELAGVITSQDSIGINLRSATMGSMRILYSDIDEISSNVQPSTDILYDNPFYNRNYITETAFGLSPGEKSYQNVMLGGNMFSAGISRNFTMSGGFELFSVVGSSQFPAFWLSPKLTFSNAGGNVHFGLGANIVMVPENRSLVAAGSVYGVTTLGNKEHNLTVGIGYAFFDFETSELPSIQFGGTSRLSDRVYLSAEHLLISDNDSSLLTATYMIRYMIKNSSLDFGTAVAFDEGLIPVLGFSVAF